MHKGPNSRGRCVLYRGLQKGSLLPLLLYGHSSLQQDLSTAEKLCANFSPIRSSKIKEELPFSVSDLAAATVLATHFKKTQGPGL